MRSELLEKLVGRHALKISMYVSSTVAAAAIWQSNIQPSAAAAPPDDTAASVLLEITRYSFLRFITKSSRLKFVVQVVS